MPAILAKHYKPIFAELTTLERELCKAYYHIDNALTAVRAEDGDDATDVYYALLNAMDTIRNKAYDLFGSKQMFIVAYAAYKYLKDEGLVN